MAKDLLPKCCKLLLRVSEVPQVLSNHPWVPYCFLHSTVTKEDEFKPYFGDFVSPFFFSTQESMRKHLLDSGRFKGHAAVVHMVTRQPKEIFLHRIKRSAPSREKKTTSSGI